MKSARLAFSALAPLALLAGTALAAVPAFAQDGIHAGSLEVPVNKSQVVSADRAIARAMIGNAAIADVVPISERSVYVLGKAMGTTSLTLYGHGGRVLSVVDIAVGPDVQGLRDQLQHARKEPFAIEQQRKAITLPPGKDVMGHGHRRTSKQGWALRLRQRIELPP